jgi:hypothetical protein
MQTQQGEPTMAIEEIEIDGEIVVLKDIDDLTADEFASLKGTKPMGEKALAARAVKREADAAVNQLFNQLRNLVDYGHQFADWQLDVAMSTIFCKLEKADAEWIKELSAQVASRPIWQLFAGWFKLLHERGETTAAIYDTDWQTTGEGEKPKTFCAYAPCGVEFVGERAGQKFHSNACGVAQEKLDRASAKETSASW